MRIVYLYIFIVSFNNLHIQCNIGMKIYLRSEYFYCVFSLVEPKIGTLCT